MNAITRLLSALALEVLFATTVPACAEPVEIGAFPEEDEDVESEVSIEEATDLAEAVLVGYNDGDYAAWTLRWDDSLRDAISEPAWLDLRASFLEKYGRFESILEARVTHADTDGAVRFSFLVRFQRGDLTLVHVYPENGDVIVGVHIRRPDGSAP
jgi:hypothetical protein